MTTERAQQIIDISRAFNELVYGAGVQSVSMDGKGKVVSMFLDVDFFKTAFPAGTPIKNETRSDEHLTFNEFSVNYNGIKYYAFEVVFEGGKHDTGKADNYTE